MQSNLSGAVDYFALLSVMLLLLDVMLAGIFWVRRAIHLTHLLFTPLFYLISLRVYIM